MAAFNYIVFDLLCPVCGHVSEVRSQVHVAADYYGDTSGRFSEREYRLGETMAWFHDDKRHDDWCGFGDRNHNGVLYEATSAVCANCKTRLEVDVEFGYLVAIRVTHRADGRVLSIQRLDKP